MNNWEPILNSIHYNKNIDNLFYLRNVCKEWCYIIKDITFQYKINFDFKDKIKYLKNIYTNISIHCKCPNNITNDDLYYFIEIYSLDISWCQNITDVSMLGNLHTLNMWFCNKITDVSMLGNLHTLNMSACNNITDISMLGNLHTLDISYCFRFTDVSMLGNLHTLRMWSCYQITDVSMLCNLHTLNIRYCEDIEKYPEPNNIVKYYC